MTIKRDLAKTLSFGLTFVLVAFTLCSPAAADGLIAAREVSYKSGNETVHAMMYTPQGNGRRPAIIVIHEWWGLND